MKNFRFQIADEVAGDWSPGGSPTWRVGDGQHFFVATWSDAGADYGWFGIYHDALSHLREQAAALAQRITQWTQRPGQGFRLATLSTQTPGWGLARGRADRIQVWRDPIGRLPLFWCRRRAGLEWGTRPAVLRGFSTEMRHARVEKFLRWDCDSGRDDFWQGTNRLRPGESITVQGGSKPTFTNWWFRPVAALRSAEPIAQQVGDLLTNALVDSTTRGGRLVSQSGGIDSTLLLALMVEAGQQVETISMVDSSSPGFDERIAIQSIVDSLGVEGSFVSINGALQWGKPSVHHPLIDLGPSSHPEAAYFRHFLDRLSYLPESDHQKTLIMGLGADQLFWCSPHYYVLDTMRDVSNWAPALQAGKWRKVADALMTKFGLAKVPVFRSESARHSPWIRGDELPGQYTVWRENFEPRRWLHQKQRQFQSWSWECSMRLIERHRRTTGVLFICPYLQPEIVELSWRLAPRYLWADGFSKWPLRRLLSGRLPPQIVERPKSGLFDEVVWKGLRNHFSPSLESLFGGPRLRRLQSFDESVFRSNIQMLKCGSVDQFRAVGNRFWCAVAAELWLRELTQNSCDGRWD